MKRYYCEIFLRFHSPIEGFKRFCLVMSINGTHLNNKDTLMICMGCDENNQLFPLDSLILYGENIDG